MTRLQRLYLGLVTAFVASFVVVLTQQAGALPAVIVGGAMTVGLVAWGLTTLRYPTEPHKLLPPYLLTAGLLMLHIWEEYIFGFAPRIAGITGSGWTEGQFVTTLVFFGPTVWILGAAAIAVRHPLGGFLAWFIFAGMVFGEPIHFVFPLLEGGRYGYFPGMWTALLPLVPAVWGMYVLVSEARHDRRRAARAA